MFQKFIILSDYFPKLLDTNHKSDLYYHKLYLKKRIKADINKSLRWSDLKQFTN